MQITNITKKVNCNHCAQPIIFLLKERYFNLIFCVRIVNKANSVIFCFKFKKLQSNKKNVRKTPSYIFLDKFRENNKKKEKEERKKIVLPKRAILERDSRFNDAMQEGRFLDRQATRAKKNKDKAKAKHGILQQNTTSHAREQVSKQTNKQTSKQANGQAN
ncbi:hypothetical protein RFI_06339 [Reticulomyxa filosa]|uniref:Uncharacterized protein n=1 Tax=Reticulomyxa filosa TaxID=46433 RepID=X6NY68_RETFI|nr:hypothetical protein RFI_06339 [Reticulomyxa filosa]|eukprot:ETO30779.1 hypothetical protein RFI_06339 [Reticulomyxa filosa]